MYATNFQYCCGRYSCDVMELSYLRSRNEFPPLRLDMDIALCFVVSVICDLYSLITRIEDEPPK